MLSGGYLCVVACRVPELSEAAMCKTLQHEPDQRLAEFCARIASATDGLLPQGRRRSARLAGKWEWFDGATVLDTIGAGNIGNTKEIIAPARTRNYRSNTDIR